MLVLGSLVEGSLDGVDLEFPSMCPRAGVTIKVGLEHVMIARRAEDMTWHVCARLLRLYVRMQPLLAGGRLMRLSADVRLPDSQSGDYCFADRAVELL